MNKPEDFEKLSHLDEATILVISDSHRNVENFRKILEAFSEHCDALAFCGDGAYDYGSLFDSTCTNPKDENLFPPVSVFVRGNGDPSYIPTDIPPHTMDVPESVVLEAAGKKILISHGHGQGVYFGDELFLEQAEEKGCSIILHGHTHIARHTYYERGKHIICPGSISLPRGGTEKSFCILTIKGSYIDAAFKKITPAGFESFTPAGF